VTVEGERIDRRAGEGLGRLPRCVPKSVIYDSSHDVIVIVTQRDEARSPAIAFRESVRE
jgi:hypothetical protein